MFGAVGERDATRVFIRWEDVAYASIVCESVCVYLNSIEIVKFISHIFRL